MQEQKHELVEERDWLQGIYTLPETIAHMVYTYIPYHVTVFLSKMNYISNHIMIRPHIQHDSYENYIRAMVRMDNDFVLSILLTENSIKWASFKNYIYKGCVYYNYIHFLREYCIHNDSDRCKRIISTHMKESGLSKNQHKKNRDTNIRWTN
jgi:hypothetical protein